LKNLLQQALRLESAGEWSQALVAFEKLLKESPYNEIADQARAHIQRIREQVGD
jgi:outer membrane protein assembly factor BamD (BamD/ComL family)